MEERFGVCFFKRGLIVARLDPKRVMVFFCVFSSFLFKLRRSLNSPYSTNSHPQTIRDTQTKHPQDPKTIQNPPKDSKTHCSSTFCAPLSFSLCFFHRNTAPPFLRLAQVLLAYRILSDEERRKAFDSTGNDEGADLAEERKARGGVWFWSVFGGGLRGFGGWGVFFLF